ncbi:hypothetical protein NC652_001747 [Populus alba x Populus x berolinensis]|nr:hypothetical protein NC652_001747 [Populus alba x Populus x berolinensis]
MKNQSLMLLPVLLQVTFLNGIMCWREVKEHLLQTDNSPTTGSVNTTAADKRRLAKDSLAFNCKKKLFPEYVERHDQELHSEQHVSSQAPQEDKSRAKLEKHCDSSVEDVKRVDAPKDERRNRKQPFPTWMMLLLVSIFGVVMALPLLQL